MRIMHNFDNINTNTEDESRRGNVLRRLFGDLRLDALRVHGVIGSLLLLLLSQEEHEEENSEEDNEEGRHDENDEEAIV